MESKDLIDNTTNTSAYTTTVQVEPADSNKNISEDPSFEEAVYTLTETVNRAPLHREIFLKILSFCTHQQSLSDAEKAIASYPEFASVAQSPYRLLHTLVTAGGLYWLELDEHGTALTPQAKIGLSAAESDNLICGYAVVTTPVGEQVVDDLAPEKRLRKLIDALPQRLSTYLDIMDFCHEKRSFKEIDTLLRSRPMSTFSSATTQQPLQPSFFVDALERSGVLVWNDGWKTTEGGMKILQELH